MPASSELLDRYVSAVRALLSPPGVPGERGIVGPASAPEIESRAQQVLGLSNDVTRAEEVTLTSSDPTERAMAAQRLLAKAATELEISAYLKAAGEDEADGAPLSPQRLTDRSVRTTAHVEDYLDVLAGNPPPKRLERGAAVPPNLTVARTQLTTLAHDACDLITRRAGETGKEAFGGLLGVGLAEIGQAAGAVASIVAGSFGAGETLSRLYSLCRDFIRKMYDSLLALIGDQLAKLIGDKVVAWVNEAKDEHLFGDWLAKAYGVDEEKQALAMRIEACSAELPRFSATSDGLGDLTRAFGRDMDLTKKLVKGLGYLKFVPGLGGPQGLLLRAAAYVLVLGWAVADGADYLDAPRMALLTRIPGVPAVVEKGID
jgi:hypothetical protein